MKNIINKSLFVFLLLSASLVLCQCDEGEINKNTPEDIDSLATVENDQSPEIEPVVEDLIPDQNASNYAKILAGNDTSAYKNMKINSGIYLLHKKNLNNEWNELEKKILSKMRPWVKNENFTEKSDTSTVFYPFGGPDFLFADLFYPYSRRYIMGGLEPCGSIIDLESLSDQDFQFFLKSIRQSIYVPNKVGFFKTNNMKTELKSKYLNGVIHLLMFYLAKTGHMISSVDNIFVDEYGKVKTNNQADMLSDHKYIDGIRVRFFDPNENIEKEIIYFSFDLSNDNVQKNLNFLTFLDRYGKKNVLLKSASYLLHKPYFSILRNNMLLNTKKVIQDDTGFPYRYFNNEFWDVQLYGTYTRTIGLFSNMYQKDYRQEFISGEKVKPIDFKIGYNTMHGESNFLFAVRKD